MAEISNVRQGKNYSVGEAGPLEALDGKLFVGQTLGFTGMEVSLNRFAPGQVVPFLHQHRRHEEMYVFIKGHGQFQVDGETFDVKPGTIVRVSPEGNRAWRNNSQDDLYCLVVQANVDSLTGQDGIRNDGPIAWPEYRRPFSQQP
ncbi:MAG: cupin domain-containing protein [Firmicutes bacterium]|nr:cupin domain-containing protein [Bacillota bacterium]